ncbi:RES family NAD+ phosphorylase [Xanthomonas citri]|uniref:RES family NAD+ phosphorylase n=1 Tax=Xanthomonas citri TaxID=346 RepID=UPI002958DDF6|nr:RES family NAD+ phosphorylase [Xanthomonas citri]
MSIIPDLILNSGTLLQHISRVNYRGQPLYFGNAALNRYDDPNKVYGVLYLAFDINTALMESMFHKHKWHRRVGRSVSLTEVNSRLVRAVGVLSGIRLANLNAPDTIARVFGLNLGQISSRNYRHTHSISTRVYQDLDSFGNPRFDGILYPSRNNYPGNCVALFNRAVKK